jgi:thiol-disulfide isomerase/thioredoxin
MARTESKMLALGTAAPNFSLLDTLSGNTLDLKIMTGSNGTVIMFICNHCPFVIHVDLEISKIAKEYTNKGFGFIAISSNDVVNYPQDSPELMKIKAKEEDYTFPYLYDETQEVAKAYDASCTPDFYLFDNGLELVYRGQLDDSRPGNGLELTGRDLRKAMDGILAGSPLLNHQKPSIGCNIKWKRKKLLCELEGGEMV